MYSEDHNLSIRMKKRSYNDPLDLISKRDSREFVCCCFF